jgi:hypothetical protein
MSTSNRIDPTTRSTIDVEPARARQTEPPGKPFRAVLAGSVNVLMSGAEVATSVVGGPILAAAVHGARVDAVGSIGGAPTTAVPAAGGGPAQAIAGAATSAGPAGDMASVAALQRESQAFNMQLLALQEQVQEESQRFSTLSNVLRARHDTAKASISNIRS